MILGLQTKPSLKCYNTPTVKRYFFGTILIGFLILGSLSFLRSRNGVVPVEITRVERRVLEKTISTSGEIDSDVKAKLAFETAGKVTLLPVRVGERVKKGQTLALLDPQDLKERLFQAEMSLKKAQADLDNAGEARRQFHEEHKYDSPSSELFAQFGQYDARVRSAESLVEYHQSLVESARSALNHATLISPIAGTITALNINEGEIYQLSSSPAVVVADLSPQNLYFRAEIDETDLGKINFGQEAEISLDAEENITFSGTVKEIAPQTSLNEVGDKIIEAKIFFEDSLPENLRLLGLSGDAEIILEQKQEALILPLEAIFEESGKKFVWKIEDGRARKTAVKAGLEGEFEIEITSGLSDGELVATEKPDLLKEGQKVEAE